MAPLTGTRTPLIPSPRRSGEAYAVCRLPADRTSVGALRRETRTALGRWGLPADVCDDVVLVVSELVTNAIVHAVSDVVVCRLLGGGPEVRVEVGSEGHSESRIDLRPPGEGGRGLVVVEALSTAWGVNVPTPGGGWTAWATIAVPVPAAVPATPAAGSAPAVLPAPGAPASAPTTCVEVPAAEAVR
jgi:anti-sigma regulatory factor (Ser/Thr protein kinase)